MPLEITARAKIITDERGLYHLSVDNDAWWKGELSRFEPGTSVVISIKKFYKKRSLRQNSTLHWYINEISDETGMAPDVIKDVLKHKFLSEDIIDGNGEIMVDRSTGEVLKRYKSTTELSTVEFMAFTEEIRLWANDFLNLQLPEPDSQSEINFKKP